MTIQELASRANVTTRTVRYYVEQGLLPPPERGRPAEYTEDHLRRLNIIRRLKEQYLPLEEIRDTMQRLEPGQVEDYLERTQGYAEQRDLSSAADYISSVLNRNAERQVLKEQVPPQAPPVVYTPPRMPPVPASAPIAPAVREVQTDYSQPSMRPSFTGPKPRRAQMAAAPEEPTRESTWQRVELAPGIELHVKVPAGARKNMIVDRLVEAAGRILEDLPEEDGGITR